MEKPNIILVAHVPHRWASGRMCAVPCSTDACSPCCCSMKIKQASSSRGLEQQQLRQRQLLQQQLSPPHTLLLSLAGHELLAEGKTEGKLLGFADA
eukprot:1156463-Pelagomonas_calceolata.AAC.8